MPIDTLQLQLINNPLSYRSILTIPRKENFGLELELENVQYDEVLRLVRNQFGPSWHVKTDRSLTLSRNAEIVSPVLQNTKQTWILLKKMGKLLEHLKPTYDNCSFQVNFDGTLLPTDEDRVRFLKLFAMYEDIIYRFSKGEDDKYRESLETYADPIILTLKGYVNFDASDILEVFSNNKKYGIVFKTDKKDLIEFRTPNMTSNPILWQNYITTFYYLLKVATSKKYPKEVIDEYINNFMSIFLLERYERLNEDKSIEFANLLFTNQQDKTNFLHQYLRKTL